MRSFWSDPFLWIHLAGLAAVPIWLELCWLGLAAGDPVLPFWLELLVLATIGIAPILWMQWQRPFYIFSLIAVVLKPDQLTEDQRRLLTLFKAQRNRFLAIAAAVIAFLTLRQLYYLAPIATPVTPFTPESRWLGLLVTAIAFLGVNLFLQVPISVLSVMLTSESAFATTNPYPLESIRSDFTLLGLPVNQVLPAIVVEPEPEPVTADTSLEVTAASETVIAAAAAAAELVTAEAEDWLEEPTTPTTIPDTELERNIDNASTETITTEEDEAADLWDVETEIAPDSTSQEIVSPPGESAASVHSEAITDSEAPINPVEIVHETLIDSHQATEDINIEEAGHAVEVANEVMTDDSQALNESEASSDSEAPGNSGEIVSSEAPSTTTTISAAEAVTLSEDVDNSAVIADSVEPTYPEAIVDSAVSTEPETNTDPEASTHPEEIADSAALTESETSTDLETLNPDMVASAPTEVPSPDPAPSPSTHPDPEDHKE
jgi:hypothetical protein